MNEFTWDEIKRRAVIAKHGLDFMDAVKVFFGPHLVVSARSETERRQMAIGMLHGVVIAVVFTMRGEVCRIVTARRARQDERERYHAHVSGRGAPEGR